MTQKFPEVGLRAVFEITGFVTNQRKYQTMMRDIDRITQTTAQKVTQQGQKMATGFATSFDELARQSKKLDALNQAIQRLTSLSGADPAAFQQYQQVLQDMITESGDAAAAFTDLGRKASVNIAIFDQLVDSGINYGDAMRAASAGSQFSIDTFDRLITQGVDASRAFEIASGGASGLGETVSFMGRQFTVAALAIGGATAALKLSINLVQKAISEYTDLAEVTRQVHYQTGLLTQEASGTVLAFQAAGVSTATAERSLTSFLGRVSDLYQEQLRGEESTSEFAKAISRLGVTVTDNAGNLKDTETLLREINVRFQELGPGVQTAADATDLFGYSGRFLLPILTDQNQSLEDYRGTAQRFGATLTALQREDYENFRRANQQLLLALQGVYNHIATKWIPVLTQVARIISETIGIYRTLVSGVLDVETSQTTLVQALEDVANALEVINRVVSIVIEKYRQLRAVISPAAAVARELAAAEEEAAQKRAQAAQAIAAQAALEADLQKQRQEAIEQLDELKTQYAQKLEEIDQDAAEKWQDILVERQREAMDRALQVYFRMDDLWRNYQEKLDNIESDFADRWNDILVERQRDALERGIRLAFKYEDVARQAEQKRQDVLRDYADKEAEQREDLQDKLADLDREARRKREDLERDHQERLLKIRLNFQDTAEEAARKNDAVAVARAIRERARDLRDEQRRYTNDQADLERSLAEKRDSINRDRQEREADQRRELEQALRNIEENHRQQVEEIQRQSARDRLLREIQYRNELEDFNKAKEEARQAADEWYAKQLEEMQRQHDREKILQDIEYQRQQDDFNKAWQRRIDEAQTWYQEERDELAVHLQMTGDQLEAAYTTWMQEAAGAAAEVAKEVATAWASEMERYQQYLTEAERQATRALKPQTTAPARAPAVQAPAQAMRLPDGTYVYPYAPGISMAGGGVVQASSPTTVVMGDAGPETGVFLPGRSGSMNVNHNFSRLGVDFAGLPGGMNTQQVQSIVYSVMTQLAKNVQIQR